MDEGDETDRDLRLNIGAGETEWGDVKVDIAATDSVTALSDMHDLPFRSGSFSEVLMDNVLEHSPDTTSVLRELHRVLRPGGVAYIYVPYFNAHGAYSDPTHRSFFSERTFDYYATASDYEYYADFEFEIVSKEFFYSKLLRPIPWRSVKLKLGKFFGDLVLAMKVVLRKPGGDPVPPSIEGWLKTD